MDNEMLKVIREELCKLLREIRTVLIVVIAIGAVCICAWLLELFSLRESTKVIPRSTGYNFYVSIDVEGRTCEGEATILGTDGKIVIIQLGDNIYITPRTKVSYK